MAGVSDLLGQLGEAYVVLRADGSQLPKDLAAERKKLEADLAKLGSNLQKIGGGMSAAITAPVLAIGGAAIRAGLQVEDALNIIRASTGKTGEALDGLKADFAEVFKDVPQSAEEVATAIADLHKRTGLVGEPLQALATQLLNLADITKTDVKSAVQDSTRLFGDWGIATQDQATALDTVFKASQQTGIEVGALQQKLVQFGAPLRQLNFSFEESAALLGKWEKEGVNAELVLGSLRIGLLNFAKEGKDAPKALREFIVELKEMKSNSEATARAAEVFGARAGADMAVAVREGRFEIDNLVQSIKTSTDTINKADAETETFGERWETFGHKLTIALEPLGTKLLEVGERALPMIEGLADAVLSVVGAFGDLPGPVQDVGIVIAGLAAAGGPILLAVGSFIKLKDVVNVLRLTELPGLARAIGLTNTALVSSPKLLSVLGLAAISVGTGFAIASSQMNEYLEIEGRKNQVASYSIQVHRKLGESWEDYVKRLEEANAKTKPLDEATIDLSAALGLSGKKAGEAAGGHKKTKEEIEAAKKAAEEYKKKTDDLVARIGGKDALEASDHWVAALKQIGGISKLGKSETEELNKALEASLDVLRRLGQVNTAKFRELLGLWVQTQAALVQIAKNPAAILEQAGTYDASGAVSGYFASFATSLRGKDAVGGAITNPAAFVASLTGMPSISSLGAPPAPKGFLDKMFSGMGGAQFGGVLSSAILGAFQGGGNVGQSIGGAIGGQLLGNLGKSLTGSLIGAGAGKLIGNLAGSILGPLGSLGFGAIGGLIGKGIGKLFGGGEGRQVNDLRDQFMSSIGGLQAAHAQIAALGNDPALIASFERLYNAKKVDEFNRAVGDYQRRLEAVTKEQQAAADARAAAAQEELDAQDRLTAAIQKYGFTIEELGPAFRRQKIDEWASELLQDFTVLKASGIDVDTILRRMGTSISEFVGAAKRSGQEVPEQMRPILERMVELGELVDENGEKIENLDGIKFGMTLTQNFDRVILKLDELIRKITGDLTNAIENPPTLEVPVVYHLPDFPYDDLPKASVSIDENAQPRVSLADGGLGNFGAGTLAVLHGMEAVIPIDRLEDMVSGAGGRQDLAGELVAAMQAAGLGRPDITIAPTFAGALADDMISFARMFIPLLTRVLRDDGELRASFASTLEVG